HEDRNPAESIVRTCSGSVGRRKAFPVASIPISVIPRSAYFGASIRIQRSRSASVRLSIITTSLSASRVPGLPIPNEHQLGRCLRGGTEPQVPLSPCVVLSLRFPPSVLRSLRLVRVSNRLLSGVEVASLRQGVR